jgi:hypothetical protein
MVVGQTTGVTGTWLFSTLRTAVVASPLPLTQVPIQFAFTGASISAGKTLDRLRGQKLGDLNAVLSKGNLMLSPS